MFARILHSILIEVPAQVWMRVLCLAIPSNKQFLNYTNVSDAVLLDAWKAAQLNLANNPFPQNTHGGDLHKGDARALTVQPRNVAVVSVPDTTIADLTKTDPTWADGKDPSGAIAIPMGQGFLEYNACVAMTMCWTRPRVYAAATKVAAVVQYEFENIILSKLGYNVENR